MKKLVQFWPGLSGQLFLSIQIGQPYWIFNATAEANSATTATVGPVAVPPLAAHLRLSSPTQTIIILTIR